MATARQAEAQFRREVGREAVRAAHARGGLISYNHLFGVSLEDELDGPAP